MCIGDTKIQALLPHNAGDGWVVEVGHRGEEVVLDLQPSKEVIDWFRAISST